MWGVGIKLALKLLVTSYVVLLIIRNPPWPQSQSSQFRFMVGIPSFSLVHVILSFYYFS